MNIRLSLQETQRPNYLSAAFQPGQLIKKQQDCVPFHLLIVSIVYCEGRGIDSRECNRTINACWSHRLEELFRVLDESIIIDNRIPLSLNETSNKREEKTQLSAFCIEHFCTTEDFLFVQGLQFKFGRFDVLVDRFLNEFSPKKSQTPNTLG